MSSSKLTLAVAVLAFVACAAAPAGPTPMGREFVSTDVSGTIPGGGPLELGFTDGRVNTYAGCNRGAASVDLSGGTLVTGELAMTMMACPGDRAGADEWMATLLRAQPGWTLDGETLTLRTADQVVTLLDRRVAAPDRPLLGTTWVVHSLLTPGAVSTTGALDRAAPHLRLDPNGTAAGSTGCNNFTGPATVSESRDRTRIEFGPLATTRRACEPDLAEVERAVLAVLSGTVEATVDGSELRLHKPDGTGALLRAA